MKVCILSPEFLPTWGGVGTYAYNLARALRDQAEVHVLTGSPAPEDDDQLEGVYVHTILPQKEGASGVSPFRFQLAVLRHLPRLVKSEGIDVVHANHAYMSDLLARCRHHAVSVVTVHTTLDTQVGGTLLAGCEAPRQKLEGNIVRWRCLLQAMERHYLRQTPAMIFVSRWVRDRTFLRYGVSPEHMAIVPNAIDLAQFKPSRRRRNDHSDSPTILFAGRLLALKGVETLLRAAARVDLDMRLLLAGPGDVGPWMSLASELHLGEDRCQFLGQVPYTAMPSLYRSADVVVLPSFSESCPLVALEAMASGTPFIAAAAGGVPEIVHDGVTGWLFPPGDADALAYRLEAALGDPSELDTIRTKALAWVRANGSIDRMADQTYEFYEEALGAAA